MFLTYIYLKVITKLTNYSHVFKKKKFSTKIKKLCIFQRNIKNFSKGKQTTSQNLYQCTTCVLEYLENFSFFLLILHVIYKFKSIKVKLILRKCILYSQFVCKINILPMCFVLIHPITS